MRRGGGLQRLAKLRLSTCGPSSAAPLCLLRQAAATLVQRLSGGILLLPLSPPLSPVKGVNEGCTAACRCCTPHPLWISSLRAVATGPWPASVHLAAQDTWIAGAQVNAEASGASDRRSFAAFTGLVGAAALAASFTPATPCRCEPDGPTPDGSANESDLDDSIPMVSLLWAEVKQELQRRCGDSLLPGRLQAPNVRLLGDQLCVQFMLRVDADPTAVLVECASAIGPEDGRGGRVITRVTESGAGRVLQLTPAAPSLEGTTGLYSPRPRRHAQIFIPLFSGRDPPSVEFFKRGKLDEQDMGALRGMLIAANTPRNPSAMTNQGLGSGPEDSLSQKRPRQGEGHQDSSRSSEFGSHAANQAVERLQAMGAQVFPAGQAGKAVSWAELAGYEEQKSVIEDTLLLALQRPDVYEQIARKTRAKFASNRPRAVLFEGPPGTGKTTSGRIIANQAAVPMIYVPLESVMSKYYGESERLLSEVFQASEVLGGCIIFLDEVDSLATTRGSDMHEATRRVLGVLLRQLDGFDSSKCSIVIAATNRKQDLDPALLSRFDTAVLFNLPDPAAREKILQRYAKHLPQADLATLAGCTSGMSGRDLRDICEQTERRWASQIIRKEVKDDDLPGVEEYKEMCQRRRREL